MRTLVFTLFFIVASISVVKAQEPRFEWVKQIGGTSSDYSESIAVDASGNVYSTGYFTKTVDFDPGPSIHNLTAVGGHNSFISKIDPTGNLIWVKQIGLTGGVSAYNIALDDSNNVYITGTFGGVGVTVDFDPGGGVSNLTGGDLFILKLDGKGDFVWVKQIKGQGIILVSMTADKSGNVYLTGSFGNYCDFDPGAANFNLAAVGDYDIFILKLNKLGDFVWARRMGGTSYETTYSIKVDGEGNVYTTGFFLETADFDPGLGTFFLTAPSAGTQEIFISKLNSSGNFVWAKQIGNEGVDIGTSIDIDKTGNLYISGIYNGVVDFDPNDDEFKMGSIDGFASFLIKLNPLGNLQWAKSFETDGGSSTSTITLDVLGNVYSIGFFSGTIDLDPSKKIYNLTSSGMNDIFISRFDEVGNLVWAKNLGVSTIEHGISITVDYSGIIYVIGTFQDTCDFDPSIGTFNLTSAGRDDIFILKLNQSPSDIAEIPTSPSSSLRISPMPISSDYLTISNIPSSASELHIYSLLGEIVHSEVLNGAERRQINVSGLPAGVYYLQVGMETRMVIKQ